MLELWTFHLVSTIISKLLMIECSISTLQYAKIFSRWKAQWYCRITGDQLATEPLFQYLGLVRCVAQYHMSGAGHEKEFPYSLRTISHQGCFPALSLEGLLVSDGNSLEGTAVCSASVLRLQNWRDSSLTAAHQDALNVHRALVSWNLAVPLNSPLRKSFTA